MSEKKWTPEQKTVINLRDCNILVSAAAGSGKTAVLVERILSRIMDKENPVNVDEFVIVTFTKAAAAEMKGRIGEALDRAAALYPDNVHLQEQIPLLHHAQISTIHSFCGYVIQNYFHRVGIDPSYRLGNDAEMTMLQADVLSELLERKYEEASDEFIELAESYLFDKNDSKMEELIKEIYFYAMSNPWPKDWFSHVRGTLSVTTTEELEKSVLLKNVLTYTRHMLEDFADILESMLEICHSIGGPYLFEEMIVSDLEQIKQIMDADGFDKMAAAFSAFSPMRLSSKKDDAVDPLLREKVKTMRNQVKSGVKELKDNFFYQPLSRHINDIKLMSDKLLMLLTLTEEFAKAYKEEKRDKGLADFHDLEQLAISILLKKDEQTGEVIPTEAADELAMQFSEIMIDEYQDSNLVQDTILRSISRERYGRPNVFMVGDVKQSIYRFRLARPELFTEKLNHYEKEKGQYRRVDLHKNFRSRSLVLDSVNCVFRDWMKPDLGGILYDDEAALYAGAEFPESDKKLCDTIEVLAVDDKDTSKELEAAVIAGRIKELVNPQNPTYIKDGDVYRPVRYHDIVILVRSAKSFVPPMERVLRQEGIPVNSEKREGFYDTTEIRMMTDMFSVLDNPRQDIPLTAVLRSPMFSFDDEELVRIRSINPKLDFYDNLTAYEKKDALGEKIHHFLTVLHELRESLTYATVADVLRQIYEKTEVDKKILLMSKAEKRSANLELLMKQAMDFDATTYHGLFQFVRYLSRFETNGLEAGEANISGENEDVVRIVTIHKSKGLEYPICFVAGMGRRLGGMPKWLMIHPELGIAAECIDNEKRVRKNNMARQYIKTANRLEDLGEELRVLYVAMTRAKEKLIFTGAMPKWEEKLTKWEQVEANFLTRTNMSCYFDVVMPPFLAEQKKETSRLLIRSFTKAELLYEEAADEIKRKISQSALYNFDTNAVYDEAMEEMLHFMEAYHYEGGEEIPVKVSVSDLKKKSLEEDDMPSFHVLSKDTMEEEAPKPSFAKERAEDERNRGAVYGTIWHQAMAVIDFTKIFSETDIKRQMTELVQSGKMDETDAKVIRTDKLLKFFKSPLGERMTKAMEEKKLYREQPFVLGVKAGEVFPDKESDETVLVQGIIDGFFEEEGELVLMDYKTDALPVGGEDILIKRYHVQMEFYKRALESITGKKVKEVILYSFSLGKEIAI